MAVVAEYEVIDRDFHQGAASFEYRISEDDAAHISDETHLDILL
jgi:hypothetical protein